VKGWNLPTYNDNTCILLYMCSIFWYIKSRITYLYRTWGLVTFQPPAGSHQSLTIFLQLYIVTIIVKHTEFRSMNKIALYYCLKNVVTVVW